MLIKFESWMIFKINWFIFSKIDENIEVIRINKILNFINIAEAIDRPKRAFLELVLIAKKNYK